ncbi:hypothetical protein R1sor_014876 [Riccia sorocarpa]|uniref:Reverse transcriptase domain-containing protein n=1 Tax=Riccia sorocarpa TaxID=122646 RepID=A0ABD3HD92_9MARC
MASLKRKAPGIDGFSYDALKEIWPLTGEDFTSMMQGCWLSASFPACLLEGVIRLLPKELRPESLHQKKGKQIGFLMLDLEKAYDRLSLDFLWEVLQRMGFGDQFISILKALSTGASVRVQLNSSLSPDFPIERGVRQGCPLAPLLFAISSVPLILSLQAAARDGNIKNLKLPVGICLDVSALADDTAVFLALEESTFSNFFRLLDCFQSASSAKINLKKSKILILGKYSLPPHWLHSLLVQLLGRHQFASTGKPKVPLIGWDALTAPVLLGESDSRRSEGTFSAYWGAAVRGIPLLLPALGGLGGVQKVPLMGLLIPGALNVVFLMRTLCMLFFFAPRMLTSGLKFPCVALGWKSSFLRSAPLTLFHLHYGLFVL